MSHASAPTVQVYVLPTGFLYLPDAWVFAEGDPDLNHLAPDYSFLICHPSGKNVLFDLGMRKDTHNYPPNVRKDFNILDPYVPRDAHDLLSDGPIRPGMIHQIILSHLHFDHTGDVTLFPDADILLGPGSLAAAVPGYPRNQNSTFDSNVFAHAHVAELNSSQYRRFRADGSVPTDFPFASGMDVFGDGTLFLVEAPGHMAGHQMAVARTGADEWVAMGGDCCHHRGLLEGGDGRDIGTKLGPSGNPGFHKNPVDARATIAKTRKLHLSPDVLVLLAHDALLEGFVPLYPQAVNGWRAAGLKGSGRETALTMEEVRERYPPSKRGILQRMGSWLATIGRVVKKILCPCL